MPRYLAHREHFSWLPGIWNKDFVLLRIRLLGVEGELWNCGIVDGLFG